MLRCIRMSGQTLLCDEKQQLVEEYLLEHDIYGEFVPAPFDMRAYADFVAAHNLSGHDITEEMLKQFC